METQNEESDLLEYQLPETMTPEQRLKRIAQLLFKAIRVQSCRHIGTR